MGYVGPNGGGKSAAMVWDTLPSLDEGRLVLSTVRLLDWRNPRECDGVHWRAVKLGNDPATGEPLFADEFEPVACAHPGHVSGGRPHMAAHPFYVPFEDWQQLFEHDHADVLMDEVTGVASSRESMGMPAAVANTLVQLRRADLVVRWSAPSWARADKIIRECSQAVTFCRGFLPVSSGDESRSWRQRRLFKWKTYDAADFEDFTVGKREQMDALQADWHYGPRSPVFSAYDT